MQLGLLKGSVEQNIAENSYKKYYPHGIGHYLGLDVHDVGRKQKNSKDVKLVPGMVTTVEPGIYVPVNDETVPEAFRGIGVRIEDDVLVTNKGRTVLTGDLQKEVVDIEALVGSALNP